MALGYLGRLKVPRHGVGVGGNAIPTRFDEGARRSG